jgi:hypothetical protein
MIDYFFYGVCAVWAFILILFAVKIADDDQEDL